MHMARRILSDVQVVDVQKRRIPSKHYVYVISSTWSDGIVNIVYRRYSKFFDLQMRLIEEFPEEGGVKDPSNRMLPFLPGKIIFGRSNIRDVALKRMEPINEYCKKLIMLPPHISQCDLVLKFFEPQPEDINIPQEKKKCKQKETVDVISEPVMLDQFVAIADYKKQNKNEVNMIAGDVVEVIDKNENGWWFVNVDEELGWVPAAYLEAVKSDSDEEGQNTKFAPGQEEKYIATQIYKAELDDEMSLDTGILVEVIQKNFDGWWLVRYRGREGWAPAMYLKKADATQVLFAGMATDDKTSPTPDRKEVAKPPFLKPAVNQMEKPKVKPGVEKDKGVPPRKASIKRQSRKPISISNANYFIEIKPLHKYETIETEYITLGEYRAMGVNCALDFQQGNKVKVIEKSPNGWWYGKIGEKEGWIPSSYIGKRGKILEQGLAGNMNSGINASSINSVRKSNCLEPQKSEIFVAVADYKDDNESSVSFKEGDTASVLEKRDGGWWLVLMNGVEGWAPSSYLEKKESKPAAPLRPKPPAKLLDTDSSAKNTSKPSPPFRPKMPMVSKAKESEIKTNAVQPRTNFSHALKLPGKDTRTDVNAKPVAPLRLKAESSHVAGNNPISDIKKQLEEKMRVNSLSSESADSACGTNINHPSRFSSKPTFPKPVKPDTHKKDMRIANPVLRPVSSVSSSGTESVSPSVPLKPKPPLIQTASRSNAVVAISSYKHDGEGGFSFLEGDKFEFVEDSGTGWWLVRKNNEEAWAPASYLEKTDTTDRLDTSSHKLPIKPVKPVKPVKPIKPKPLQSAEPEKTVKPAYVAHSSYSDEDGEALSFNKGDKMEVLERDNGGWWLVQCNGKTGWVPSNYLKLVE